MGQTKEEVKPKGTLGARHCAGLDKACGIPLQECMTPKSLSSQALSNNSDPVAASARKR